MSATPAKAESTPITIAQAETTTQTHSAAPAGDAQGAAAPAGELHTETGVAHGEQPGKGVFPPFDQSTFASQVLWLAITFGLFYLIMSKVIVPRIGSILETRHDRIAQDLDEASRLKSEADSAIATYEQELADARAKGHAIASEARDAAKAKAEAERLKIEESLNAKIAAAEDRIAGIKEKALADVGAIAEDTAAAVVEQLIGGKATKAEIAAAVKLAAK
ncbi:F0F1 ATP synthase subunit B [Mycoplana dimorpha]|uniref:ATP synthase subunit b n=1 Tax=Mycoplana dimorpha TaxID=28320 RepID=A0A2T5BHF5_MYCDI|nr:F0F1 ATP synthase subunit B [Mycoplana dimorpha]PTM98419.1 F-type H+-transporting ATPase subunit b [Mycoplana dimorpha]